MACWLIKSEPFKYSWDDLRRDKRTYWDGVRNHKARNNLAAMKRGDLCLFYHSNEGLEIVGIARVVKEAYPDPTADHPRWVVVDVAPRKTLRKPVTLAALKADPRTRGMEMVRQSRLSVSKVTDRELAAILELAETTLPGVG
ncbi:MAG: EVE domain-containing protein [Acidobacteriota bacterium]|jgi:predicted RNA-binding protein with PUA-like domain